MKDTDEPSNDIKQNNWLTLAELMRELYGAPAGAKEIKIIIEKDNEYKQQTIGDYIGPPS